MLVNEAAIMNGLAHVGPHPNIVSAVAYLSQYFPDPAEMNDVCHSEMLTIWNHGPYRPTVTAIAMEFVPGGSLDSCLKWALFSLL